MEHIRGSAVTERCVNGASLAPLTTSQKRELVLLARDAFASQTGGAGHFDTWRHGQVLQAVERAGLSKCRQEDYNPLKAHFSALLGRRGLATRCLIRAASDPRRQAIAMLEKAVHEAADVLPDGRAYAAGFVRNKRHVALDDADAKTIWHAVFCLRRRAQQLRRGAPVFGPQKDHTPNARLDRPETAGRKDCHE
jgi:hypothetical protein